MSINKIDIFIEGVPVPQPRPKARIVAGHAHIYTPQSKVGSGISGWKQVVGLYVRAQAPREPWDGPVALSLIFYLERTHLLDAPRAAPGVLLHYVRPDIDNYAKAVLDVMTDVGVWTDDGRVCDLDLKKRYVAKGYSPGVRIIAEHLDPQETFQ